MEGHGNRKGVMHRRSRPPRGERRLHPRRRWFFLQPARICRAGEQSMTHTTVFRMTAGSRMIPLIFLAMATLGGCARAQQPASAAGGAAGSPYEVRAPAPAGFDRAAAQRSTQAHLMRLIAINTQNPPGNEIATARYFDSVFKGIPGIETRILDVGGGRANFVARLRATNPRGRPVLVM